MYRGRIIRDSSSFNLENRGRSFRGGRSGFGRGFGNRSHSSRRFQYTGPRNNPTDRSGQLMLCSFCNSWYHLFRDCPDRNGHAHSVHWASEDVQNEVPPQDSHHAVEDDNVMELSTNFTTLDLTQYEQGYNANFVGDHSKYSESHSVYFMDAPVALAFNMDFEASHPSTLYRAPTNHAKVLPDPSRLTNIPSLASILNTRPIFHGICLDEGAPSSVTERQQ